MAKLILYYDSKNTKRLESVNTQHLWYDLETKEMLTFNGGKLDFSYDFANKKLTVSAVPETRVIYQNVTNRENADNWLKESEFEITKLNSSSKFVFIECNDEQLDEVEESLSNSNINYEVL